MKGVRFPDSLEPLLVPIDSIRQHPDNPNNGDIDALVESIQINGFNTVLTVDRNTGYIVAGNHRWQALHALGATHAPVVFRDFDDEGMVRYLIADNETGKLAVMDRQQEAKLLRLLTETDKGLAGTGVTQEKYLDILNAMTSTQIPDTPGFGNSIAPSGIFQVVLTFDNPGERDDALEQIREYEGFGGKIRSVNL